MSWLDPPPEPMEILVHGYIREQKKITALTLTFPEDVKNMIYLFYPKKCTVYGIGANNYNELGMNGKLTSFHELSEFGSLSIQPQDIFFGYSRFTVKTHEDRIYSIGNNYNGDCGCGKEETQIEQFKEIDMTNVIRDCKNNKNNFVQCVSSGTNHMLFVLNNIIYATGQNGYGQCGNNTRDIIYIPYPINHTFNTEYNRIISIECGYNHTIFLNKNGKIYGCGRNEDWQCGIDNFDNKILTVMREIECGVLFKNITVGGYHNLCISMDNKLYIFGKNKGNELGIYGDLKQNHYKTPTIHPYFKDRNVRIRFTSTKHEHCMVVDMDGICYLFGANISYQISKTSHGYIREIVIFQKEYNEFRKCKIQSGSCGYNHTLLLSMDHSVIGFGGNEYQQTNPLNQNKNIKDPHTFNNMEIGIKFEERIVRAIAGEFTTLLIQQ